MRATGASIAILLCATFGFSSNVLSDDDDDAPRVRARPQAEAIAAVNREGLRISAPGEVELVAIPRLPAGKYVVSGVLRFLAFLESGEVSQLHCSLSRQQSDGSFAVYQSTSARATTDAFTQINF